MPQPLPDLKRDQQCFHYMAPTGERCGSPAMKGAYYCFQHDLKRLQRSQGRVLIDPEITCMEIPPIEDRASIFIALSAVVHRLAENTIDTRRAGQMIYGLQVAMRALEPPSSPRSRTTPGAQSSRAPSPTQSHRGDHGATPSPDAPPLDSERQESHQSAAQSHPAGYQYVPQPDPEPESELEPGPAPERTSATLHLPVRPSRKPFFQRATDNPQPATPRTIPITKESLLYFLRSRHCAHCNAELFPAS